MAFLGHDDFLVSKKDDGIIRGVVNGMLLSDPLLDTNVLNEGKGMFGAAIVRKDLNVYVNISYLAADSNSDMMADGIQSGTNDLYRFQLVNESRLTDPLLIRSLILLPDTLNYGEDVNAGNVYRFKCQIE
jgi:aldose sugar dehydrogenase